MDVFNLNSRYNSYIDAYVKKYVQAMAYTPQKYRDQYRWWDYEQLKSSPPEDWNNWVSSDPSLADVLKDASSYRSKSLKKIEETYGLNISEASKLVKTYIGYLPAYGGYICQIGPYISKGFIHGEDHVIGQAVDKFAYFVIRKRKSTPNDIARSIAQNIASYHNSFGVEFNPDDFSLIVKAPATEFDSARQRQKKEIKEKVESLNPNDPRTVSFFQRAPIIGEGSHFALNNQGYEKILRQLMGLWYEDALREFASEIGKDTTEIAKEMLTDLNVLREIYNRTYKKWEEARDSGEAAAIGMPPPPKFLDKTLRPFSGAQGFTTVPSNELMANQLGLRSEILTLMRNNTTNPIEIAEILNSDPQRQIINKRRIRKKDAPIIISADEVAHQIAKINDKMREENKDISEVANETNATMDSLREGRGYDDLKTAFEMASVYFASQPVDVTTGTKMGEPNTVLFNPPENFENFTSEDLMRLRQGNVVKEEDDSTATPEQIKEDIGEQITNVEEEKVKIEEIPVEDEIAQPDLVSPSDIECLLAKTVNNLIRIASELDSENKDNEAEEVHKVIRKYIARL